jgi:hypothetical protein
MRTAILFAKIDFLFQYFLFRHFLFRHFVFDNISESLIIKGKYIHDNTASVVCAAD